MKNKCLNHKSCEPFEIGISESYNMIRLSVMKRVSSMYKVQKTWDGPIYPTIIKKLENFGKVYRLWSVFSSGGGVYETRSTFASYCLDCTVGYPHVDYGNYHEFHVSIL
ncbi:hypothetical protein LXL04_024532 [Taraxacum kok-saghyz]